MSKRRFFAGIRVGLAACFVATFGCTEPDGAALVLDASEAAPRAPDGGAVVPDASEAAPRAPDGGALVADASEAAPDAASVCSPGLDSTCNEGAAVSWYSGHCLPSGTCACALGSARSDTTGRCVNAAPNVGGYQVLDIAAAARKDEGALVFVDKAYDPEQARVSLQWVDELGVAQGDRIELASSASTTVHSPTVATDGTRYVACWSQGDQVACSSVSPGETKATAVYAAPGESPVLVYGTGSWVLAYNIGSGPDAAAQLQRFDANFQPMGAPGRFSQAQGALRVGPALATRATGFVLVTGAPVAIYTLDGELNVRGTPTELGVNQWSFVTVAATETTVTASVAAPYGSHLFQVDERGTLKTTNLSGGGKVGLPIALRAKGSSIYGAWFDSRPHYEDLTSGSPVADPYATSSPSQIVTLQVRDSVLVAVAEYAGVSVQRVPATTR